MDTCCIDKTSTGDTQEAINAMFRWYRNSDVCYAFLRDVEVKVENPKKLSPEERAAFVQAHWFTRGWTIQELLAPDHLIFVDKNWREIGDKRGYYEEVEQASKIDYRHMRDFQSCSIAQKLYWGLRSRCHGSRR